MDDLAPRIIVALDFADQQQVLELVNQLDPALCRLKVGKELFVHAGPDIVRELIDKGFDIFLDLKFHDIPNTVAKACQAAAQLGVWMVNVHASGGVVMLQAAREAINACQHQPLLVAVTVLTSLTDTDLQSLGIDAPVQQQVLRLAQMSKQAGCDGIVCSAQEAAQLRQTYAEDFCLVTPGIRPLGVGIDDQQRMMTPEQAIVAGVSYLVIGRPITQADDPATVLQSIYQSISI